VKYVHDELTYGTERHKLVLDAIMRRVRYAREERGRNTDRWKKDEEQYLAFMPERDVDTVRRNIREQGKPQYTTLFVPYSYATLMAAHSYWVAAMLGRDPVFQFAGRHGESEMQRNAVEAVLEYQRMVGEMTTKLYIWLLDAGKYGVGYVWPYWCDEVNYVTGIEERMPTWLGVPIPGATKKKVRVIQEIQGYSGHRLMNIRPANALADPRVTHTDIQKGEFFGYEGKIFWNALVSGQNEGIYYNIERAKDIAINPKSEEGSDQVMRPDESSMPAGGYSSIDPRLDMKKWNYFEICIEIIPRDWKLGSSTQPEKWLFTVLEDGLIVGSRPLGEHHNKFPVGVMEYEIDGYALHNRSMSNILEPLSNTINFLVNQHFYNVRKTLNNEIIYDPSRVMSIDLKSPDPGKLIRLKPAAYGSDVRTAVTQLQVADVTQAHMRDILTVIDFGERVSGVNGNLQGILDPRGRKTATEVRGAGAAGASRQKTTAEWMGAQGFHPLSMMLLAGTQQHLTMQRGYRIAGETMRMQGQNLIDVAPDMIQGFFDFVPISGDAPQDKFAIASLWRDLFKEIVMLPPIAQQYNLPDLFGWIAQLAGLRNIDRFRIQLTPDQMLADQARRGNVVPIGGQGGAVADISGAARGPGAAFGGPTGAGPENSSGLPAPSQVAGMGPVS